MSSGYCQDVRHPGILLQLMTLEPVLTTGYLAGIAGQALARELSLTSSSPAVLATLPVFFSLSKLLCWKGAAGFSAAESVIDPKLTELEGPKKPDQNRQAFSDVPNLDLKCGPDFAFPPELV